MTKNVRIGALLDIYGELLTDKQFEALDLYYNDDLSLAEIAENMNISRQGVRDFIIRGEAQLTEFDEKLKLMSREADVKAKISDINEHIMLLSKMKLGKNALLHISQISEKINEIQAIEV